MREETLAGGVGKTMVIVVPAFAEGDEGEEEIITGVVFSIESAFSPDVSQ